MRPLTLLAFACHAPPPPPEPPGDAEGVAAADLDGDGVDEWVLVEGGIARWRGGEVDTGGDLQATARGDIDGDGREEALLATGASRARPDAPARVTAIGAGGARVLWERAGPRNQITELRVIDGAVWLGAFADEREVQAGWLTEGRLDVQAAGALATRSLPVDGGVVLGRVYGDAPRSDGDLRLLRGGAATPLPTLRGVRALAAADLDGDGHLELLVGDGWHFAYAERAQGRVLLLEGPDWARGRVIAHLGDEYSVRELDAFEGRVLATGARRLHLLQRDALGWADHDLGELPESGNAVIVRTAAGPAALVAGRPARLVALPP